MSKKTAILLGIGLFVVALAIALAVWLAWNAGSENIDDARPPATTGSGLVIATWNVRGYPEKTPEAQAWFTRQVNALDATVMCIQEIATEDKVRQFSTTEAFPTVAFTDSSDGQDNAVFASGSVTITDLPDPTGFQHPAQAAFIEYEGFDATIVNVHLSWTDKDKRADEKRLLRDVVAEALLRDPDVIVVGDFNTPARAIDELALAVGLEVMVPEGQDGIGTTYAGNRYDHFLISPDLASEEAVSARIVTFPEEDRTIARTVSDHVPVVARFRTDMTFRDRP